MPHPEEKLTIELADTPEKQRQGLMHRRTLGKNDGMLFVSSSDKPRSFWMKNTYIPLSVAFLSPEGEIRKITDMNPKDESHHVGTCQYALEVNQGWFDQNGVKEGDTMDIQKLTDKQQKSAEEPTNEEKDKQKLSEEEKKYYIEDILYGLKNYSELRPGEPWISALKSIEKPDENISRMIDVWESGHGVLSDPQRIESMQKAFEDDQSKEKESNVKKAAWELNKSNHVFITGVPGSGKTTLANQLAEKKKLPVIHGDQLSAKYHTYPGTDELREKLKSLDNPSIVEGVQILGLKPEDIKGSQIHILELPKKELIKRLISRGWTASGGKHYEGPENKGKAKKMVKDMNRNLKNFKKRNAEVLQEVNQGWFDQNGVKEGDTLDIQLLTGKQSKSAEEPIKKAAQELIKSSQDDTDQGVIGIDLDGTLAEYNGFTTSDDIGDPIPAMKNRVQKALDNGQKLKILTARVAPGRGAKTARDAIRKWTRKHFGQVIPCTAVKDRSMVEIWDDRAVSISKNTGRKTRAYTRTELEKAAQELTKEEDNKASLVIKPSVISGKGLFSNTNLSPKEKFLAFNITSNTGNPDEDIQRTTIGRYVNHSDKPTAVLIQKEGNFFIQPNRHLSPEEEITLDYRNIPWEGEQNFIKKAAQELMNKADVQMAQQEPSTDELLRMLQERGLGRGLGSSPVGGTRKITGNLNAPSFAYQALYGKQPDVFLSGRTTAPKKIWRGIDIDADLDENILARLNDMPGIEGRSSDSGKSAERPPFFIFRMEPPFKDEKAPEVAEKLKSKKLYSLAEPGREGRYRIVVTDDISNKNQFWQHLPDKIQETLQEVNQKPDSPIKKAAEELLQSTK